MLRVEGLGHLHLSPLNALRQGCGSNRRRGLQAAADLHGEEPHPSAVAEGRLSGLRIKIVGTWV